MADSAYARRARPDTPRWRGRRTTPAINAAARGPKPAHISGPITRRLSPSTPTHTAPWSPTARALFDRPPLSRHLAHRVEDPLRRARCALPPARHSVQHLRRSPGRRCTSWTAYQHRRKPTRPRSDPSSHSRAPTNSTAPWPNAPSRPRLTRNKADADPRIAASPNHLCHHQSRLAAIPRAPQEPRRPTTTAHQSPRRPQRVPTVPDPASSALHTSHPRTPSPAPHRPELLSSLLGQW